MNDSDFSAIDLETIMGTSLQNWQKDWLGGFKKGEMAIVSAGRNTGKSTLTIGGLKKLIDDMENLNPNFEVLTTGTVDGKPWYTITCKKDVSIWIRETALRILNGLITLITGGCGIVIDLMYHKKCLQ